MYRPKWWTNRPQTVILISEDGTWKEKIKFPRSDWDAIKAAAAVVNETPEEFLRMAIRTGIQMKLGKQNDIL